LMKRHLGYAMPFALAVSLESAQTNLHMYVVSSYFTTATFAIYSVGCLQVPLVDFLMTSTSSVMMVQMSEDLREGRREAARELWLDTTRKLAMVFACLVGGLIVTAHQLIVLLFTSNYAASAPLFSVWTLSMLFAAIMTDSVLRVHADTRFLILLNIIRLAVVAVAIGLFLKWFGLMGAVLVTLLSTLTAKGVGIARVRKLLGCGFHQVLPWKSLASILAITGAAMLPAILLKPVLGLPLLASFLVSGALFTLGYAALLWFCGPLKDSERRVVVQWLQSPVSWVSGNRRA
jgi:O-antigen/teichoic acid export membrane protein